MFPFHGGIRYLLLRPVEPLIRVRLGFSGTPTRVRNGKAAGMAPGRLKLTSTVRRSQAGPGVT
jgi:hypothetical protein